MSMHGSCCRAAAVFAVVFGILLLAEEAAAGTASLVNTCAVRIRPTVATASQIYISLQEVELYNAAGVKIPSSSITASSSTAWDGGLTYVASYCNDGILTTEYLPSVCTNGVCRDVWTNLCHTGRVDSNPTMTFTYPCQQGLSKAVLYNFRKPSGAMHETGSMLSQFSLDVLFNGYSIAYSKPLQAVLVQEVTYMDPSVEANSCSVRFRPTTAAPRYIFFRELAFFNSRGVQIPATQLNGSLSSQYVENGQDFTARKCLDGNIDTANGIQWNLCITNGPPEGDFWPWMRFGYPCSADLSKVVVYNRFDWGVQFTSQLSMDITNNGKIVYTYEFNEVQNVYNTPIVPPTSQPTTWQCSRPRGKDAQAISKGDKTAEQVCVANGNGFFFTDGVNNDYPGCGSCACCKMAGAVEDPCKSIHRGCEKCGMVRIPGTTKTAMACTACYIGWRLRRDGESRTCDCAPGMAFNGTGDDSSNWCAPCPKGQYCPGGGEDNPESAPSSCPEGLATISTGAKSPSQCFTAPGFGRTTTLAGTQTVVAVIECPIGTYNTGGNTAGCQKCGSSLTTLGPRSANASMCLAPAGSYVERGTGKACQKGTYSEGLNSLSACIPCPDGVTTRAEGSSSSAACALAKPGFYLVNSTAAAAAGDASRAATAAVCPPGSYQGREAAVYECSPCDFGYYTRGEGAAGNAECLAPPGWELKPGASLITECEVGYYKEGWNKNPCSPCGTGLTTAKIGSVSVDACLVPAGWGLTQLTPEPIPVMCANGSYGVNSTRAVVATSRCVLCPPNMFTADQLTNVTAAQGYMDEQACLVRPGWGTTATGVEICPAGSYNEGLNRKQCRPCDTGYTSLAAGADGEDSCVVQSGWALDTKFNIPKPCDVGYWGSGGSLENRNGTCVACPTGFTTQRDESYSAADCNACAAGFGGTNCTICPHNTFSTGGLTAGTDCVPCASGAVSARGATDNTQCYPDLVDADKDVFHTNNESSWTNDDASSSLQCQSNCRSNSNCILFRFSTDQHTPRCHLLLETADGSQAIGFKAGANAQDYAFYKVQEDLTVGVMLSDVGEKSAAECMAACKSTPGCELISMPAASLPSSTGACKLLGSELSSDWIGMYHIQGNRLHADSLVAA